MTRNSLQWRITIPADGNVVLGGIAPALIQWQTPTHPALNMKNIDCTLIRLEGFHAEATRATTLLESLGLQQDVRVSRVSNVTNPYLVAHIGTPQGTRIIGAPN